MYKQQTLTGPVAASYRDTPRVPEGVRPVSLRWLMEVVVGAVVLDQSSRQGIDLSIWRTA